MICKKIIFTAIVALLIIPFASAETEVKVKSNIDKVTVFLSGAQVHRKGKFVLKKGTNKIVFEGISPNLNKNSIQVKGKGNYIILDVAHKVFYPEPAAVVTTVPEKILNEISRLKDSLKYVRYDLEDFQIRRKAFQMELDMLLTSGVIKGQTKSDSIELLKMAMDYLRIKVQEINSSILKLKRSEFELTESEAQMKARLLVLKNYNAKAGLGIKPPPPIQQIIVTVSSEEAISASMQINYMVSGASWSPSYDLRASNTSSPVMLTYKANIKQNTGEDWDDVKLTLSSVNPNRSTTKPELPNWYINYYQELSKSGPGGLFGKDKLVSDDSRKKSGISRDEEFEILEEIGASEAQHVSNYFEMNESLTNVEFKVGLPYSIPSNGVNHLIAVQQSEIPSGYTHYLVPKMDQEAFLVAKMTDWEKLNLLPAVANIFFDGTYVGQTRIDPAVMNDTISLALGRDRGIMVKRIKLKDEEKVKTLSSDKVKTITWELEVRNNKSGAVNLVLQDHIPVTQNDEIKISLDENGGAEHAEKTGKLEWRMKLDSRDHKKFSYTFTVKFDKDKTLAFN
jgi:uncharacterized protein (TIGR02231 family)